MTSVAPTCRRLTSPAYETALLVILAGTLLAGCGGPRATHPTARTSAPTIAASTAPTAMQSTTPLPVAPGQALTWAQANLPAGFGLAFHQSDLAVAPGAGMVAYSCGQVAGDPDIAVVVTHDRGASWTRVADIPVAWGGCDALAVDENDPSLVVVHQSPGGGGTPNAVTFDRGASWQVIADAHQDAIAQTASYGARIYAILYTPQSSGVVASLASSDDHMRTWHTLLASAYDDPLRAFWVNPTNGSLLARAYYDMSYSDDGGQRWDALRYPTPGVTDYVIQQPATNQPWHVCAAVQGGALWISCSGDSGKTWQTLPSMPGMAQPNANYWFVGLARDGALLLRDNTLPFTLFRLPAGARQWQALGQAPASATGGISYYPAAPGGALWIVPAESDGAGAPDPATAVYCAAYGG